MVQVPLPDAVPLSDRQSPVRSAVESLPLPPTGSPVPTAGLPTSTSAGTTLQSACHTLAGAVRPVLTTDPTAPVFAILESLESLAAGVLGGAAGPLGLFVVLAYSVLVAVVLPLPGELVLAVPVGMGLSPPVALGAVVLVSSGGKALGGLAVLRVSRGAGLPAADRLRGVDRLPAVSPPTAAASGADTAVDGVRARLAGLAERYGHVGLTVALAVPFAPDTTLLYAFSVVESDRARFAAAAFVGTAIRLAVVAGLASAALSLV